jgi:cytidine deaminase
VRPPTDEELALYERAREAAVAAYAPYSRFTVGAALRAAGGSVVCGVNVENASYGLSICAERSAVFAAVSAGHRSFDTIAVHAGADSAPPCGACRQVLAQFAPALTVVYRREGEIVAASLEELLPEGFRL